MAVNYIWILSTFLSSSSSPCCSLSLAAQLSQMLTASMLIRILFSHVCSFAFVILILSPSPPSSLAIVCACLLSHFVSSIPFSTQVTHQSKQSAQVDSPSSTHTQESKGKRNDRERNDSQLQLTCQLHFASALVVFFVRLFSLFHARHFFTGHFSLLLQR